MKRLAFLPFIFLIVSCEFVPDEVTETIIQPPLFAPPVEFSLNDYEDTIKIGWLTDFSYSLNSDGRKILSVKITLGEKILIDYVKGTNAQVVTFSINPSQFNNGNYPMHIEIITGTGSGSLAEALDGEGFKYLLDWPVVIDNTLPIYTSCILKAVHIKEAIQLSWEAFNHLNFRSYSIYRSTNAHIEPVKIATISSPLITSLKDTTYWEGERNTYYLRINTPAGFIEGNHIAVNDTLTGLKAQWLKDGKIHVSWDKAKNIESLGGYYIYSYFNGNSILEQHFISDSEQNFVNLIKSGFAYGLTIKLKFIPAGLSENSFPNVTGTQITFSPQPVLPQHKRSYILNGKDFIILAATNKLYRYNPYELITSDSIITRLPAKDLLTVSNDGSLFAYTDFTDIYLRQTDNFSIKTRFPAPPLLKSTGSENLAFLSLSNNGKLVVGDLEGITYLYDALSGSLIDQDTILIDAKGAINGILSSDGSRLILCHQKWPFVIISSFDKDTHGWKEIKSIQSSNYPYLFWSALGSSLYISSMDRNEKRESDRPYTDFRI